MTSEYKSLKKSLQDGLKEVHEMKKRNTQKVTVREFLDQM